MRHHVVGRDLQIVGRKVVVLRAHTAFKQAPGVSGQLGQIDGVLRRHGCVGCRWTGAAGPPYPHGCRRPQQAQSHCKSWRGRGGGEQRREHGSCHHRQAPVPVHHALQPGAGLGLDLCGSGGRPLKQVAVADRHSEQRPHDGVNRQDGLLQQQRQMPQPAPHGPHQIHGRLPVEMQLGHIVPAG